MGKYLFKYIETSKVYKNVTKNKRGDEIVWRGLVLKKSKCFPTEREAAIYVDMELIKNGKNPINILKAK